MISAVKRVWSFMSNYRWQFFGAIGLLLIRSTLQVLEPFILGLVITELTANILALVQQVPGAGINYPYIYKILALYLIRGAVLQLALFYANVLLTRVVQQTTTDIRVTLMDKLNRLPVRYFDSQPLGDVLSRMTGDVESLSAAMQQIFLEIASAAFTLTFVFCMMFILKWQLALVLLMTIPLTILATRWIAGYSQPEFKKQAASLGRMTGFVQENLSGYPVIKLFGQEPKSVARFGQIIEDLCYTGFRASFIASLIIPLTGMITHLSYATIAVYGGYLVMLGQLTMGNLQAFIQYVWQVGEPVQVISQLSGVMQTAIAAVGRISEVLDHPEEDNTSFVLPPSASRELAFEGISFRYQPDVPLIEDFSLDVQPGERIAIVGPTGAGKTTIINLLLRFYDVDQGAITMDGTDIKAINRQDYRQQFGMVLQDTWLFEGTIRDNLRFGRLEASDDDIVQAAKAANVDHFIRTLPGGYDMWISPDSSNISQGQKQLLTIARAILSDPEILILDEATSSVDTRLEQLIQEALERLMADRTSFVIAHRLSTIQNADRILVMNQGQIIEQGNHEALLKQQGFYYQLYQSQFDQT